MKMRRNEVRCYNYFRPTVEGYLSRQICKVIHPLTDANLVGQRNTSISSALDDA